MSWSDEYLAQVQAEIDSPNTVTPPAPAEPQQALPSAPEQTLPEIPAAPPAREYAADRLHDVLQTVPVQDEAPAQPAQEQEDRTEDALFEDFSGFSAADFGMERQPEPIVPQATARMHIQGNPGLRTPEEIARFDKLAEDLGRPFGMVDADPDDARREAKSLAAESVPNGDRWVAADEQNAAILGDRAGELNAAWQGLEGLKLLQLDNKDKSLRPDWHPKLKDMQEYFDTLTDPVAQSGIPRWWQGGQKAYAIGELQRVRGLLGEELGDLASRAPNLIGEQEKARMQELGEMLDVIDERLRRAGNEGGPLGLFWALQQASRTIKQDLPMAAKAGLAGAGAGAVYGGLAGSAAAPGIGTGIGAAGGAIAGFKAGAAGGFFLSATRSEYGNMVADMRNMKDDAGNPVDLRTIVNVAKGYGIVSGAIETGSEWLGLKALGVGKLATGAARKALGTAAGETGGRVAAVAANKSIGRAVAKGAGAGLVKMGLEGAEEGSQEATQILMTDLMRMYLSSTGQNYFAPGNRRITLLDQENLQRIGESAVVGAAAGFWMGAAPTILNIGSRVHDVNQARAYAEAHTQAAQVIDQNMRQGAQLSPQRTESFLQVAMGMDGNVLLPADAVLELQNEGVNIAGPMGWGEDTLAEAAAEGSDLVVPVARLHARLDPATMGRVAQIMRPENASYSAADAQLAQAAIDRDVESLVQEVEQHEADMTAFDQEAQRIRGELEGIARQRNALNTALTSSQDTETSVTSYVNTHMQLLTNMALEMAQRRDPNDGHTYTDMKAAKDMLGRLSAAYMAQRMDARQQAINDVMREAGVDLNASRTAQRRQFDPEFDAVYGRLDYDSVVEAYDKDFANELRQEMGPGFFTPKGKGERIENIAENYLRGTQGGRDGFMDVDVDGNDIQGFMDRVLMGNKEYFSRMANGRLNQMATTDMLNQMAPELGVTAEELRQEYDAVVNQYQGTDQWMKAPNGQQSNLNERQWVLVRTPRFKAWFGDWENDPANASKVVDENGEPLVTNHGDRYSTDYLEYDEEETDYHGFWSFMDSSEANAYEEGRLLENFLNVRKPLEISLDMVTGHPTYREIIEEFASKGIRLSLRVFGIHRTELDDEAPALYEFGNEIIPILRAKGFDAWIAPEEGRKTIAVFASTQIKSATHNTGAFSQNNPNILHQFLGEQGAASLDRAEIERLQQSQTQGAQVLGETSLTGDGTYMVTLFRGANLSTLTHELGHVIFKEFQRLVQSGQATERMAKDWQELEGWLAGLDDDAVLAAEYSKYQKGLYDGRNFAELTDLEKVRVRETARQEWLARGLEQYLREGKAPTAQTEGMFRRFAKWLTRVYKQATQLNIQLTDEVRGVFARLIAAEEDIEEAAQRSSVEDASAALLDALGLHGAERLSLQGLIQEDKDKAAASLRRQRESIFLRHRKQWEEWADEELNREPVYAARDDIRKTPVNWDDFAEAYGEDMARALAKKLPGCISHEGTASAEEVAAAHGYANAGAMAQAILEAPGKRERKRDIISGYREAAERELDAEDYLYEQEGLAEQQEKIGEFVYRLEAKGRTQNGAPVEGATGRERRAIARETLRDIAANILAKKNARDACSPNAYRRQAARYMRLEREAILRKDWVAAIDANNKARINLELERQARQNRDVMTKLIKRSKKFLASKSTDPRARYGVYLLSKRLSLFEMNRRFEDNAADKTLEDWHSWTEEMKKANFLSDDSAISDDLLTGEPQSWWSQTWEGLLPSVEALTATIHSERASRQAQNEQNSAEWKDYIQGLADSIRGNISRRQKQGWDKPGDLTTMLQKFGASGMNADTIAMALDDDIDLGPVWRAVVKPIRDATWRRNERLRKAGQDVKQLFSVYTKKELLEMRRDKVFIPKLGRALTKEQMLCVLLNCGNADNYQRLLDSPKMDLTPDSIREIIDMLDERDVRFAQSVWDYFETFRKEAFDIEEKLTGVRPHAVEATPVSTRFGELRGGYYPIRYDLDQNGQPVDTEAGGTISTGAVPTVDHGSMKQRAGKGKAAPVSMELDTIPEHVVKTIHMIEFREPVRQVARVLNNATFDDAISSTIGKPYMDSLKGWLRFVAGERPPMNQTDKVFRWARKNLALMTMGFSLATTIAQTTGLLVTIAKLGPRWTFEGVFRAYAHGPRGIIDNYQFVMKNSAMMRSRIQNTDRDVYEFSTGIMQIGARNRFTSPLRAVQDFMAEHGFKMMGWMQMVACDLPTWHAAYAKRMAETKGNHKEACEYADLQVERLQTGSAEYNQSSWQHGGKKYGEIAKLATPFYTYFGALFQLFSRSYFQIREHHDAKSVGRMANLFFLTMIVEPVLMNIIMSARPDDDDDEDWAEFLAKSAAKEAFFNPFNMVVGVRDVASAIRSGFEGYGGNYRPIPAADLANWAIKAVKQIDGYAEGKTTGKKAALTTLKAAGYTTGIVNNQEIRLLEAWWNWLDGTTPEFEVADIIRKQKK